MRKCELIEYLKELDCKWISDPSNQDITYLRSRIRRFFEKAEFSMLNEEFSTIINDIYSVRDFCFEAKQDQDQLCLDLFKKCYIPINK